MSKLEISWAYRVLDHFWHFFCEVGLTLGNIDKSRIIHIRGQRGFHDDEYSMSVSFMRVLETGFSKISPVISPIFFNNNNIVSKTNTILLVTECKSTGEVCQ